MTSVTSSKFIEHPLESVFGITPNTTVVEYKEIIPTEIEKTVGYDAKDDEIENQLQTIYDTAMGSVEALVDDAELVEGKYKARMGEVTATMLSVALNAVQSRSQLKMHKDKLIPSRGDGTPNSVTTNNNLIMTDRNDILRLLQSAAAAK